jgi:hypothetical protein
MKQILPRFYLNTNRAKLHLEALLLQKDTGEMKKKQNPHF